MINMFKLCSGEVLIADVTSSTDDSVYVTNPLVLVPSQKGLMLMAYMPGVNKDEEIPIKQQSIMSTVEFEKIDKNLVNDYNRQFGSGLVMAENIPHNVSPIKQ